MPLSHVKKNSNPQSVKRHFSTFAMLSAFVLSLSFYAVLSSYLSHQRHGEMATLLEGRQKAVIEGLQNWRQSRLSAFSSLESDTPWEAEILGLIQGGYNTEHLLSAPEQQELRKILPSQIVKRGFLGYFAISPDRMNIASMRDENIGVPSLLHEDDAFFNTMNDGQVAFSKILKSDVVLPNGHGDLRNNLPTAFVGRAIFTKEGKISAYFLLRIPVYTDLAGIVKRGHMGLSGETYLFDINGVMVTESKFEAQLVQLGMLERHSSSALTIPLKDPGINLVESDFVPRSQKDLPLTQMAQSAIKGQEGSDLDGYNDYRGVEVIGRWNWLDEFQLGIATEMDANEAYSNVIQVKYFLAGASTLGFLMICSFIYLLDRKNQQTLSQKNYLSSVMNNSADGIIVIDEQSIIRTINKAGASCFGYEQKDLLGEKMEILLPQEHHALHSRLVFSSNIESAKRIAGNRLLYGQHKDGSFVPIEVSVSPIHSAGERFFVGIVRDISERIEAEEKIQKFKSAVDSAFDSIVMFDCKTYRIEYGNVGLVQLSGYSQEELQDLHFYDLGVNVSKTDFDLTLAPLFSGQLNQRTFRTKLADREQKTYDVEVSLQLIETIRGEQIFVGFLRDISAEINAANAIHQREKTLRSVMDTSRAQIIILDQNENIHEANNAWDTYIATKLQGSDLKYIDRPYVELMEKICEQSPNQLQDVLNDIYQAKVNSWEAILPSYDGQKQRWFQVILRRVEDIDGVGCIAMHFDVSELISARESMRIASEEAAKANHAKSTFLATMSHEIRTPMNGVVSMVDLLQGTSLNAEQRNMMATVRKSAYSLLTIINDILDLSKIESGQMELENIPVSVNEVIESVAKMTWYDAKSQNVFIHIQEDLAGPERILGDPTRLRQLVLNLVNNAFKFSKGQDKAGQILINTSYDIHNNEEGVVTITIKDNGIGMTPEQMSRVFHPFTQADASTTREYGGTGLGLSICSNLVETMNGTIEVNGAVGEGTEFKITLPYKTASGLEALPTLEEQHFVLYSTSSQQTNDIVKHAIRSAGGKIEECHDIQELSRTIKRDPDAVMTGLICILENPDGFPDLMDQLNTLTNEANLPSLKVMGLSDNPSQPKGMISPHLYMIAAHPLIPRELIWGAAVLAGLASPILPDVYEDVTETDEELNENPLTTIEEAEQAGQLILIAEDHETNQQVIMRQLSKLGLVGELFEDGQLAFDAYKSDRKYGLVLTDCHMPKVDGFELTRLIREEERGEGKDERIPIVALTANALVGEAERCFNAGMDDYLSKPVELAKLKYTLRKWMKKIKTPEKQADNVIQIPLRKDQSPFDYQMLGRMFGNDDPDFLNSMLQQYWKAAQKDKNALHQALEEQSFRKLRESAHAAKGGARSAGAMDLGMALEGLEEAARSNDWTQVHEAYANVTNNFDRIESWIVSAAE